jgi:hypothetical protein
MKGRLDAQVTRSVTAREVRGVLIGVAIGIAIIVAVPWLFVELVLDGGPMARCDGRERFAATAWRDPVLAYGDSAVRGCMVDDLLSRHNFREQSRAQVVVLLGEPRPTDYFSEYQLVYWLGPERGLMSVDSEWLVFRIDTQGRVTEYRLVTD